MTDTKCWLNTGCLKPHRLRLRDRAPGAEAKPVKYSGVSVKLYTCQHWPSSVENLMAKDSPQNKHPQLNKNRMRVTHLLIKRKALRFNLGLSFQLTAQS